MKDTPFLFAVVAMGFLPTGRLILFVTTVYGRFQENGVLIML